MFRQEAADNCHDHDSRLGTTKIMTTPLRLGPSELTLEM